MRLRIDFRIQELDVPAETARGITFGDEVDASSLVDFFDRCRDAARLLFHGPKAHNVDLEKEKQLARLKKQAATHAAVADRTARAFDEFTAKVAQLGMGNKL